MSCVCLLNLSWVNTTCTALFDWSAANRAVFITANCRSDFLWQHCECGCHFTKRYRRHTRAIIFVCKLRKEVTAIARKLPLPALSFLYRENTSSGCSQGHGNVLRPLLILAMSSLPKLCSPQPAGHFSHMGGLSRPPSAKSLSHTHGQR